MNNIYCNAGDIARVTFPNGVTQDFSDTPITIHIYPTGWTENYSVNGGKLNFVSPTGTPQFTDYVRDFFPRNYVGNFDGVDFWDFTGISCLWWVGVFNIRARINPYPYIGGAPFCGAISREWNIDIKSIDGLLLHNFKIVQVEKPTVSVQCVSGSGCPPSTLDCGDCCLDCASVFNGISDARKDIYRLR